MAMNYQYGTSPRKIAPEYIPNKRKKNNNSKKKNIKNNSKNKSEQKQSQVRSIALIVGVFFILLVVSYRNSLINEKFKEIQNTKSELSSIQKVNEQLKVSIEGSLNLENIEKEAQEKLNLQKLDNDQKVYVTLPKKDYTEAATNDIELEKDNIKNIFEIIVNKIFGE